MSNTYLYLEVKSFFLIIFLWHLLCLCIEMWIINVHTKIYFIEGQEKKPNNNEVQKKMFKHVHM